MEKEMGFMGNLASSGDTYGQAGVLFYQFALKWDYRYELKGKNG